MLKEPPRLAKANMEEASLLSRASRAALCLSAETTRADIRERLARIANQYAEVAEELEFGADNIRHPELLERRHED